MSQTNPITESITVPTIEMYRRAGGDDLVWQIMSMKAAAQTTKFTAVHHRETPERLMKGEADAGNVWITEALEYEIRMLDGVLSCAVGDGGITVLAGPSADAEAVTANAKTLVAISVDGR